MRKLLDWLHDQLVIRPAAKKAVQTISTVRLIRDAVIDTHKSTIKECISNINARIKSGHLQGNGCDETAERNGLILAHNILFEMLEREEK